MKSGVMPRDDQESHFNQTAVDRMGNVVYVYSDDPVVVRKLEKMGFVGKKRNDLGGMEFTCEDCIITVRRKHTRKMTDEQLKEARERIRNVRRK